MLEKVKRTIIEYEMFPKGATIVVGVSGGVDSIALLYLLHCLCKEMQWQLLPVHIHHGLRGAEADADTAFVETLCKKLGYRCIVHHIDVKQEAKARGLGEEETGRLLRYQAFREVAGAEGRIAVAHHRKDQAETLLMRLCRGTGLTGLVGMLPVRDSICRPLLFCSRKEIEDYCLQEGLSWREDSTNQEERYTRNKLRWRVLPLLETIHPQAEKHIAQTAALLATEEAYLEQQAAACEQTVRLDAPEGEIRLHRFALQQLHPAMRRRVLRRAMQSFLQREPSLIQILALEELLQKQSGKKRVFAEGLCAEVRYDTLVLVREEKKQQRGFCYALPEAGEGSIPEAELSYTVWSSGNGKESVEISKDVCTKVFDYDKIKQGLFCRTREAGDFIRLKTGRKKIKDVFIDEKIPKELRACYPLFAMGQEILWIPGIRSSIAYLPDENTTRYLYLQIRRRQK